MHLIDQQQFTVGPEAELVLGIGQHNASFPRLLHATIEQRDRNVLHVIPELAIDQTAGDHVITRERLVMPSLLGLGGRSDEGRREGFVLHQAIGQRVAVDHPGTIVVATPQRCGCHAGDATAHDHFDRQGLGLDADQRVLIRHGNGMVGHDVSGGFEPPGC